MWLARNKVLQERFRQGDQAAMAKIYRYYEPGVAAFLRKGFTFRSGQNNLFFRGSRDQNELENFVQEVFRRAFEEKARQSYNGTTSFSNWILAIARNMVINQFRNKEVAFSQFSLSKEEEDHRTPLDEELPEEYSGLLYAEPAEQQDKALERAELHELLDNFLSNLTEDDRNLVMLRFSDGMGQEETAAALGSTRMKVRTAESRIKSRLKSFLSETGYLDDFK